MRFIKVAEASEAAKFTANRLASRLVKGERVLWLLSGGSAIAIAVLARQQLKEGLPNLTVSLVDERYGPPGHVDSNWAQLERAGFDGSDLNARPVLTGDSLESDKGRFAEFLATAATDFDYRLGLFGLGADGHTAGILPGSVAVGSTELVAAYREPDYQRLTVTPSFIPLLDEAILYAVGPDKQRQLEHLNEDFSLDEQPAQVLKRVKSFTILNDYKGETL